MERPRDLLEFLRRSSEPDVAEAELRADVPTPVEPLRQTTRMLVLRRSQAIVAAAAAGLGLILAFLLGMSAAGPADAEGVWVIKVAGFEDSNQGRRQAQDVTSQLGSLALGDEVNLAHDAADGELVVTVGAWLEHPGKDSGAAALRKQIRGLVDSKTNNLPFADADFWRLRR